MNTHSLSPNLPEDVANFHAKFGLSIKPVSEEERALRLARLSEEFHEYLCAHVKRNDVQMLDALVDLVYIAIGTADRFGWDFNEAWRRVHAANMAKQRVEKAESSKHGSKYDIVKPAGWSAPILDDLVS